MTFSTQKKAYHRMLAGWDVSWSKSKKTKFWV